MTCLRPGSAVILWRAALRIRRRSVYPHWESHPQLTKTLCDADSRGRIHKTLCQLCLRRSFRQIHKAVNEADCVLYISGIVGTDTHAQAPFPLPLHPMNGCKTSVCMLVLVVSAPPCTGSVSEKNGKEEKMQLCCPLCCISEVLQQRSPRLHTAVAFYTPVTLIHHRYL